MHIQITYTTKVCMHVVGIMRILESGRGNQLESCHVEKQTAINHLEVVQLKIVLGAVRVHDGYLTTTVSSSCIQVPYQVLRM